MKPAMFPSMQFLFRGMNEPSMHMHCFGLYLRGWSKE